jgi:hypothetical protein
MGKQERLEMPDVFTPNLHFDGDVSFNIRQVYFDKNFSHWEGELIVKGETHCEATAPTFWGVSDILTEYIFEQTIKDDHPALDHNWFKMDANDRENR